MIRTPFRRLIEAVAGISLMLGINGWAAEGVPDFNREIRPILSGNCFQCHGPDEAERKGGSRKLGGLRLDVFEGATDDHDGSRAIVPKDPAASELLARVRSSDPDELMPPPKHGKPLSEEQTALLERWIAAGAPYAPHWSYVKPARPEFPPVKDVGWVKNGIDTFVLSRLGDEGVEPEREADRATLARRLSIDLIGLPPDPEMIDHFVSNSSPNALQELVDRLLASPAFGERWGRVWLDLARYADSKGYADDPPRTIWAYRDWVIRALNANQPFDQFTVDQIAGDLMPNPTEEQLVATAFHRNTMTNNEGGTDDEEFRNVAVVDRVNTTMQVWMGTTMACAQCHTHKYDPITHEEYFQFFAFFNQSADADRNDEAPVHGLFTANQKAERRSWELGIGELEKTLSEPTGASLAAYHQWVGRLREEELNWQPVSAFNDGSLTAVRLTGAENLPDSIDLVQDSNKASPAGRYVRIELPGKGVYLSLAEVEIFSGDRNIAREGKAKQSSTAFAGPARLAIDGNTDGDYDKARSTTHTASGDNPWWEVKLKKAAIVDEIVVWNRTDGVSERLNRFKVRLLDDKRREVWSTTINEVPKPSEKVSLVGGKRQLKWKRLALTDEGGRKTAIYQGDGPLVIKPG
ncbi:MAG: DUF1549 domain-containing protein, partial [Verrucomicrobiota bacterium]